MTLYAQATTHPETHRLLHLYQRRLRNNLTHALRPLSLDPRRDAEMLGALIDGLYLRAALSPEGSVAEAKACAERALETLIGARQ